MATTIIQKIFALKLSALLNGEHFNFMDFVIKAISKFPIIGERFAEGVEVFTEAFEREDEVYQKYDRKRATKLITEAGTVRDERFRILRDAIKIAQRMTDEAVRTAADILMGVIDLYGGAKIPSMGMNEKSGVLTNLIQDLESKQVAEVTKLNVGGLLGELKTANDEFIRLVSDRTLSDSEIGKSAMRDARTDSDNAYRALIDGINLEVFYGRGATFAPFINYMNTEIDRYRIQIGQGVGGSTSGSGSSGSGDGSESEGVIKVKNATFKFIGGRTEIIPVEVGTVLIAPTNTEGYKWKPAVPELMPKTNKTFTEVPIEDREVTLTFHFLSHEDEILRGIVGSALEAPSNTEGCHWEPDVPPTFPDEDMTFNEVLDEPVSEPQYAVAKFIFQSGESEEIRQLVGSVLHAPQNTEGCRWIPEVPATMPAVNTTYNEVAEGEPLYTIAWYDKSTPIQWYELPAGAAVPEAPEPPAGHRWAQTFTVMPARDVDIVAVAI